MTSGLICVEGGDASGKSTLIDHLRREHGARVMHCRIWRNMARWHFGVMRRALRLVDRGELVCLDRHWVSEFVYGPIYRGGPAYPDGLAASFDDAIQATGAYVLCVRRDLREHLTHFNYLRCLRSEAFHDIEKVIQCYRDLLDGNVAHPGENHLDRYIQYGDFRAKRRVYHYDMDQETPAKASKKILRLLRDAVPDEDRKLLMEMR